MLPIVRILRRIREVEFIGQVDILIIRIGSCRGTRVVLVGELKIELLAENGSRILAHYHQVLQQIVIKIRYPVILGRELEYHRSPIGAGVEKPVAASDRDAWTGDNLVPVGRSLGNRVRRVECRTARLDDWREF